MTRPLRRIVFALSDGTRTIEVDVHHLDDSETNQIKQMAESGRMRLRGVRYEVAETTKSKEWMG